MRRRGSLLFCLFAGGGDALTGLLLLAEPRAVLRLLGAAVPGDAGGDLVLLRFVGVFVGSVGFAYLYPWLTRDGGPRLRNALEITAGMRLAVALFLGFAVMTGRLDLPWATVGAFDAVVATAQIGLLARGFLSAA